MKLIDVVYPKGQDWSDGEARHDARRCVDALTKRFPGFEFKAEPTPVVGTYEVCAQSTTSTVTYHELKMFAEGFMASAFLWER